MLDQAKAKEAFEEYIEKAQNDERILGAMLSGGRAKGQSTENSDYDVIIVTTDKGFESVKEDYSKTEYIDSLPHAISTFKEYALSGTRTQYDKYTFTHAKPIFDKTGELEVLIAEKGTLSPEDAFKAARSALGGYLNSLHRSIKNMRDGNSLAGLLDAQESLPNLSKFLFAIEERLQPYNKFLKWELQEYPLMKLPVTTDEFLQKIEVIAKTADLETQKEVHRMVKELALENRHQEEIDDWADHYFG